MPQLDGAGKLSTAQVPALTTAQIAQITPAGIGAVATSQLGALSGVAQLDASGKLVTGQIPALTTSQIAQITPAGIGAVATSQLTTLATANGVPQLSSTGVLSTDQFATISGLPVGAVGSSSVVPVVTVDTKGRVTALTTAQISSLGGVSSFSAGTTGLSPSSATTGAITLSGTLAVGNGGTGLTTTPTNGQIDIGNGSGFTRTTLSAGSSGNVSITNGAGSITIDANQRVITASDTTAALRITQTGTGESLRVEDSTNPDATPFVIDQNGNVGIGTASPTSINGNVSKILALSGQLNEVINFVSTDVNNSGILEFNRTGRSIVTRYAQMQAGTDASDNGYFLFQTAASGSGVTEKLRINHLGNIGIGTASPAQKLDVSGVSKAVSFMETPVAAAVGSAYTVDLTNGTNFILTLTSATAATITLPSVSSGQSFVLFVNQPASGTVTTAAFTATPAIKWAGGLAPTITATLGKTDVISFVTDGTSWYGSYVQNF